MDTIPTSIGAKTPEQIIDYLMYRHYRENRNLGIRHDTLALFFGEVRCETFAAMYRTEQINAGARIADDHFCKGCGARGHRALCPTCARDQ